MLRCYGQVLSLFLDLWVFHHTTSPNKIAENEREKITIVNVFQPGSQNTFWIFF
jgi:hypothetical protein